MKRLALVLGLALAILPGDALAELRYPNLYAKELRAVEGGDAFLHCDYTARTCISGRVLGRIFAGVMLDEDRQTVLAHIACFDWYCTDYDRGIVEFNTAHPRKIEADLP